MADGAARLGLRSPRGLALWGLFAVTGVVSSLLVLHRPPGDRLSDLHIYYGAAETVRAGAPLYGYVAENGGPFTYPPFAALLFAPLTWVPETALRIVWLVLTCVAVAALAWVTARAVGRRQSALVAAIACALLVSAPVQSNLRFGQVSVFIVLLALIDGAGLTPARYRGVLVGVAAAIKLTPLLFVVFFLLAGRRADARRAVAAFAACAVLGAAALPLDSWTYWSGTFLHTSRIGDLASLGNQSVHGALMRVGVPAGVLPLVWAALVALISATALWHARRIQLAGEPARAAVLVGCATVAASPVSWTHHQVWTVLAAMFLVAAHGRVRRVAGVVLLVAMIASLGVLLRGVSTYPGWQFVLENARAFGAVAVCLAGLGALTATATRPATGPVPAAGSPPPPRPGSVAGGPPPARRPRAAVKAARPAVRTLVTVAAALAAVAVLPLPAAADPTFKAYLAGDVSDSRYFYYCRTTTECELPSPAEPVTFGLVREETKSRVNGLVHDSVTRLSYVSAPGGTAREIPIITVPEGRREFSFRSASLVHGTLTAYGPDGAVLAAFTSELTLPG